MITHQFNAELQILEVFYKGNIYINDLLEYGEMIRTNDSLPRDLKILTNATDASYHLTMQEISFMMDVLKMQIVPYNSVKTAVIQEKPIETAISMLVDIGSPIPGYKHKVFSTRHGALDWLLHEE
jgi:hypothetical protein